eukprot:TRINITY_DN21495_c0_g1_i1.p1 TRINITY_DN21495_c0_g1~~TRINITY_DN21495_c0_g1_i1.p1  ORF type:complete len:682 (+),score=175.60 TRINITY_DN21495_c0_g1_i1:26-2047(+)
MSKIGPVRIKDALGKLFMKIHPDLLWADPAKRKQNEESMQGLNEILAWEKNLRKGNVQQTPQTKGVSFFTKEGETMLQAELKLPNNFTPEPHTIPQASAAVNSFLNKLLINAEVLGPKEQEIIENSTSNLEEWKRVSERKKQTTDHAATVRVSDYSSQAKPGSKWEDIRKERRIMSKYEAMGDFGAAFDGMDIEIPEGAHEASELPDPIVDSEELKVPLQPMKRLTKHKPRAVLGHLAEDFNNMMKEFWKPEDVPDITELITSDLIHYDQNVSPVDCAKAIATLQEHLSTLRYDKWYFVPLFITTRFGIESDLKGFISIPYWFEPKDFLEYVISNQDHIRTIQEESFEDAKGLEHLVKETRQSIPLTDIVIRCNKELASGAINTLGSCKDLLRAHNCTEMVFEIIGEGWQYGARDTGILQVPSDVTRDGLREFLEYLTGTNQLEPIKSAYNETVRVLNETDRLTKVCYEVIGPKVIDVETEEASLEHKFEFIKELYSISGELSRYDWQDYTFSMGPLDLDWSTGILSLPHNFHGANFAQTVHMLHEQDNKDVDETGETPEPEHLELEIEARRIKSELMQSGLLELDPEKQTKQQKALQDMIENYDSPEGIEQFIKDSFPSYVQQQTEQTSYDMNLLAQQRTELTGYTAKKLRRYFKSKSRPRIGPDHRNWDFL